MSSPDRSTVRRSPVRFESKPLERISRDGWEVVLRYEDEGKGPWVVDLSHRRRWDFQDRNVDDHRPLELPVPPAPGGLLVQDGLSIARLNRTQVAAWHLGANPAPDTPRGPSYTETTDGHCMLAFVGSGLPTVIEPLTNLDLFDPARTLPRLTQGPVLHVPCQVATLAADCVLMTFARGYGQTFVDATLHAARASGLRPAGEDAFNGWFERRDLSRREAR